MPSPAVDIKDLDYVSLLLDSSFFTETPTAIFALFLLGLMRMLPLIAIIPFLGAKNLNRPAKIGMGIAFVLVLFPLLVMKTKAPLQWDISLIFLGFKEFFVGLTLGLFVSLPFHLTETAGIIIDHQRGASSLMVTDPVLQNQNAPTGVLLNLVALNIFFIVDGPFYFFDALVKSYEILPPDQFLDPTFFKFGTPFYETAIDLMNKEMTIAVQIAAPCLITMLMTDLFLGIANRLAPQVMITFLGMPLKSWMGIFILMLGWTFVLKELRVEQLDWMNFLQEAVTWYGIGKT